MFKTREIPEERLEELGQYGDEVLNASLLPERDLEQLRSADAHCARSAHFDTPTDADAFLRNIYLHQE